MATPIGKIRNIGIAAHIDAGKTTVTERILFITGKIHRMGEVHEGRAQMDWMEEEQERGISITAAATTFPWKGCQVNLIDTPGHVDFTIEVERSLRVLDGVVIVLCGVGGVETQTEMVWAQATRFGIPRLAFVNKLDRAGSSCLRVVGMMRSELTPEPLPLQIAVGAEASFQGIVDLVEGKCHRWEDASSVGESEGPIPAELEEEYRRERRALEEKVAEYDEQVLDLVAEGREVPTPLLKAAIRRATISLTCVPVLYGSALRNKGIQPLMDAVVDYLPAPNDLPPMTGNNPATGIPEIREASPAAPLAAFVFKTAVEQETTLSYVRVYSGTLVTGEEILVPRTLRKQKVPFLYRMHANKRQLIERAGPGEIVATTGLKGAATGDTLCDPSRPIALEPIHPPEPVVSISLEAKSAADRKRLLDLLAQVASEDPTFRFVSDEETGQVVASGMGELHLEVVLHRFSREHHLDVRPGRPQVICRETVAHRGASTGVFDRVLGGKRHVGEVGISVEPGRRGSGTVFETAEIGPLVPPQLIAIVEQAVRDTGTSGPHSGYPVDDIRCRLEALTFLPGTTTEVGVRLAAGQAFRDAMQAALPLLMEPIMEIDIVIPVEGVGEVIADLGQRGGRVEGLGDRADGTKEIRARVPLSRLFGYATDLRSRTRGKGTFVMKFSGYDTVGE
jgi:elongation factor G